MFFHITDKVHNRVSIVNGLANHALHDAIEDIIGYEPSGECEVPYPIEVECWGELAHDGQEFETEWFLVVAHTECPEL